MILSIGNLLKAWPYAIHPELRQVQQAGLEIVAERDGRTLLELPTGSGKTAIGLTFLLALAREGLGPLFYVTPTKTQVETIMRRYGSLGLRPAFGRHEHQCLYPFKPYAGDTVRADEIPCLLLTDCPSRVDQETGATYEFGAPRCPYYDQKYEAKQGQIVVCTTAFYLFTQLFSREWPSPAGLVLDEIHGVAGTVRNLLAYEITDYTLFRAVDLLKGIDVTVSKQLDRFARRMVYIIKSHPASKKNVLDHDEIGQLLDLLEEIDEKPVLKKLEAAIQKGLIDSPEKLALVRKLEVILREVRHYRSSLKYSLPEGDREPLNYTVAYYVEEKPEQDKVQYKLIIKAYYVAPVIRRLLGHRTVGYSATIGDPRVFGYETGITHQRMPFQSFPSTFPEERARLYVPTDVADLRFANRISREPTRTLRRIAKASRQFADHGHRSLVVVVSDHERQKFLNLCVEEGVTAISYGNGTTPRLAASHFKDGNGDVLVGTTANFGEGIDLPDRLAPVIFFLRPGYPNPNDPLAIFEERRHGKGRVWRIRKWRVMLEALQVRGRNIRSEEDRGVTFFMAEHFREIVFPALPEWLKNSYTGDLTFEECIEDALTLLGEDEGIGAAMGAIPIASLGK